MIYLFIVKMKSLVENLKLLVESGGIYGEGKVVYTIYVDKCSCVDGYECDARHLSVWVSEPVVEFKEGKRAIDGSYNQLFHHFAPNYFIRNSWREDNRWWTCLTDGGDKKCGWASRNSEQRILCSGTAEQVLEECQRYQDEMRFLHPRPECYVLLNIVSEAMSQWEHVQYWKEKIASRKKKDD